MFRGILSSRAILAGLVLFVVIVAGSLIYTWHAERDIKGEEAKTRTFLQQVETHPGKSSSTEITQSTEQMDTAQNEVSVEKQETEVEVSNTGQDPTDPPLGDTLENALGETEIAELREEINAEEEKAEAAVSAEESRRRELQKQQSDIFAQIKELMATEGGAMHSSTDREKMHQILQLQKELLEIQEKIEGAPDVVANYGLTLAEMVNSSLTPNGEIPVSEYVKITDYVAAEGDLETASRMRVVIQRALNSGDDVIKPEHIDGLQ